ncbi:hypothetical protein [Streptococcus pluranimalium]|uniref:hypothetical protein n=1 Tax=Streptococcus pluranimalium TaxID=82348 RepID=UPI0039FCF33A
MGDWLSFYGSVTGIVISLIVIHFQLSPESEKELRNLRPEIVLNYDFQLIKPNCRIYFDDKEWYKIMKLGKNKIVDSNSFEKSYSEENKRDKILSLEMVNNQPMFNVYIFFGEELSSELIPRISTDERVYVVSKKHQNEIYNYVSSNSAKFQHVPEAVSLYFTTLSGEVC